jgi:hypothetical protein
MPKNSKYTEKKAYSGQITGLPVQSISCGDIQAE